MVTFKNSTAKNPVPQKEQVTRRWLSDSFNRGAQTIEEATASARAMAEAMERTGMLLRAPARS